MGKGKDREPDPNQLAHFFITEFQLILLAVFITGLMQFSNPLAIYLIICCPFFFFLMVVEYFIVWRPKEDVTTGFNIINMLIFIATCPIFFGIFFGIFHPTAKLKFEKVENCFVSGTYQGNIEKFEKYSILYVNFDYEGEQYLGYGCASNQSEGKVVLDIPPYKLFYKGDDVACGPSEGDSYDSTKRLLQESKRKRKLAVGGSRGGGGGGGGGSSGGSFGSRSTSSSSKATCKNSYKYSQVKLPSWICIKRPENYFDLEEYTNKQSCYVSFLNNKAEAKLNGKNRMAPRFLHNIPAISYRDPAYYPQPDLIALILFAYYPFLLSFNTIFIYSSNYILRCYRKLRAQQTVHVSEEYNNYPNNNNKEENQFNYETPQNLPTWKQSSVIPMNVIPMVSKNNNNNQDNNNQYAGNYNNGNQYNGNYNNNNYNNQNYNNGYQNNNNYQNGNNNGNQNYDNQINNNYNNQNNFNNNQNQNPENNHLNYNNNHNQNQNQNYNNNYNNDQNNGHNNSYQNNQNNYQNQNGNYNQNGMNNYNQNQQENQVKSHTNLNTDNYQQRNGQLPPINHPQLQLSNQNSPPFNPLL